MRLLEIRPELLGFSDNHVLHKYLSCLMLYVGECFVHGLESIDFGRAKAIWIPFNKDQWNVTRSEAAREPSLTYNIRLARTTGCIQVKEEDIQGDLLLKPFTLAMSEPWKFISN